MGAKKSTGPEKSGAEFLPDLSKKDQKVAELCEVLIVH
jgi:hypothetical protein